jgi:hypothetical protein
MEAHAKHQENDADFRELAREISVPDKSGRERTKRHTCEEIAHERRQAQPVSHKTAKECQHEPQGDRDDERGVVRHLSPGGWRNLPITIPVQ